MIYGHVQHCNHLKHSHSTLVDEIGQGKASKARLEPTNQITHQMRGLGIWRHAERVPHACTAREAWFTHPCGWDNVLGQVSVMGLQHKADGVPQAAIPRRKFIN